MVVQCSAYGCDIKSSPETRRENITFYKFPLHDPVRLEHWTRAVNYGVPPAKRFQPNQYNSLCSQHFEETFFEKSGSVPRLKPNAIPTKFQGRTLKNLQLIPDPIMRTPQSASKRVNSTSIKHKSKYLSKAKHGFNKDRPRTSTPRAKIMKPYTPKKKPAVARVDSLLKLQPVMHPAISKTLIVRLVEEDPFCCVPHCETENSASITYVTLPTDNERYEEWVTVMGRPDLLTAEGTTKARNAVICTSHFSEEMWVKSKTRNSRLVKHAVPSIFPIEIKQEDMSTDDEYYVPPKLNKSFGEREDDSEGETEYFMTDVAKSSKKLNISDRLKILKRLEARSETYKQIGLDYGVSESCVRSISKAKDKILSEAEKSYNTSNIIASIKREPIFETAYQMEGQLKQWIEKKRLDGDVVAEDFLLAKAKLLFKTLSQKYGIKDDFDSFNTKGIWFKSFKKKIGFNKKTPKTNGVKRKLSSSPVRSNKKQLIDFDDDYDPKKHTKPKLSTPGKRKGINKSNMQASSGNNLTCPVCSRELSKWERLKTHLVNIHDYYINENDEVVPPMGMHDEDDDDYDTSETDSLPPSEFLQVNLLEGTEDSKSLDSKDKGLDAVLKLKSDEIDELKKEIERLKAEKTGVTFDATKDESKDDEKDKQDDGNTTEGETVKKPTPELQYTAEDKKLWENLVMAEIKKSKKYMEGLEKAQKIVNSHLKENLKLKHQLKKATEGNASKSNASYAMKKRLNEEIQKNKKLHDRVRQLLDENKSHLKSSSDNNKLSSMFAKLKKTEENLKIANSQISDQNKKFRHRYTQQTRLYQRKSRQLAIKMGRLHKKAKMMSARLNGIREIGSIPQIIRDSSKYLTNQQVIFSEGQMKANTQNNEKFWSPSFQEFVHTLYQTSPKAYKIYQRFFALPSVQIVRKWISENELVTKGINDAMVGAFTEEAKSLHELEETYKKFTEDTEDIVTEQNNNSKINQDETSEQQILAGNIQQSNIELQDQPFMNGLENIPDQDEDEIEELEDEEEDEGRINEKSSDNMASNIFDSDDEEEGVLKSDDDNLEDLCDSDWSNDSNVGESRRLSNNSLLK